MSTVLRTRYIGVYLRLENSSRYTESTGRKCVNDEFMSVLFLTQRREVPTSCHAKKTHDVLILATLPSHDFSNSITISSMDTTTLRRPELPIN